MINKLLRRAKQRRYSLRLRALGFVAGKPFSREKVAERTKAQAAYHKTHRKQARAATSKYYNKIKVKYGSSSNANCWMYAEESKQRRMRKRKENASGALKEVLRIQKLYPHVHNRKYHIISGY